MTAIRKSQTGVRTPKVNLTVAARPVNLGLGRLAASWFAFGLCATRIGYSEPTHRCLACYPNLMPSQLLWRAAVLALCAAWLSCAHEPVQRTFSPENTLVV